MMDAFAHRETHCIFCGAALQGKPSGEHVIAQWLHRELGLQAAAMEEVTLDARSGERGWAKRISLMDVVLDLCCSICNNHWMSALENAVRPPLKRHFSGKSCEDWTPKERQRVSVWAVKTAMAAIFYARLPICPDPGLFSCLKVPSKVPRGFRVIAWPLGSMSGKFPTGLGAIPRAPLVEAHTPEVMQAVRGSFQVGFYIGNIMFGILYCPSTFHVTVLNANKQYLISGDPSECIWYRPRPGKPTSSGVDLITDWLNDVYLIPKRKLSLDEAANLERRAIPMTQHPGWAPPDPPPIPGPEVLANA